MVEIVGYNKSVMRECTCKNCGAILKYGDQDMQDRWHTDYTGDTDHWKVIICPGCNRDVTVKNY